MFQQLTLVALFSLALPAFSTVFLSAPTVSPVVLLSPLEIDDNVAETFSTNLPVGAFNGVPCGTINFAFGVLANGSGGTVFASIPLNSGSPTLESVTVNPFSLPVGTFNIAAHFDSTGCAVGPNLGPSSDIVQIIVLSVVTTPGPTTTYTQGGWGSTPHGGNPGALLANNFSTVFGGAGVTIGCCGLTLTFDSAHAIDVFLPQGRTPGVLTASAIDPTTSAAGVFAGQVLALQLAVSFSNAGVTGTGLAGLHLQSGPLAGQTVGQVLVEANIALGGGPLPAGISSISELNTIVDLINSSCDGGVCNGYIA
jgi:hypothetical protein